VQVKKFLRVCLFYCEVWPICLNPSCYVRKNFCNPPLHCKKWYGRKYLKTVRAVLACTGITHFRPVRNSGTSLQEWFGVPGNRFSMVITEVISYFWNFVTAFLITVISSPPPQAVNAQKCCYLLSTKSVSLPWRELTSLCSTDVSQWAGEEIVPH